VLRASLAEAALRSVRARTWERALTRLGDGYRRAIADHSARGSLDDAGVHPLAA
jgi:hypothetical protein